MLKRTHLLLAIVLIAGAGTAQAQMPAFQDTTCLVDVMQAASGFFTMIPPDQIPDSIPIDTVWAAGDCDQATMYTAFGPIPIQLFSAERTDSCEVSLTYSPLLSAAGGMNDTVINVCQLGIKSPGSFPGAAMKLRAGPNPFRDKVFIYFNTGLSGNTPGQFIVFNSQGVRVVEYPIVASEGVLIWNGQGSSGQQLPSGRYQAVLSYGARHVTAGLILNR